MSNGRTVAIRAWYLVTPQQSVSFFALGITPDGKQLLGWSQHTGCDSELLRNILRCPIRGPGLPSALRLAMQAACQPL